MVVVHMIDSNNEQQSVNAWKEQEQLFYYYYCVCLLVLYRYHTHAYTVILRVNAPPPGPIFRAQKLWNKEGANTTKTTRIVCFRTQPSTR